MLSLFIPRVVNNSLQPHGLQHARPPCPSPSPQVCPSSCPFHWWCHPAMPSSDTLFSFCPQSFPASVTFPMSWLFTSGGQNTGASASASVLPMSIRDWFPSRLTGQSSCCLRDCQQSRFHIYVWMFVFLWLTSLYIIDSTYMMWTIFKVLIECVRTLLLFCGGFFCFFFFFFGFEPCGVLAPQTGMELHPLQWKAKF